jgi:DNA-binding transcriptional ArsR family regulator
MSDAFHSEESLRYLRALGDPDRLKIVQSLRSGPKSVGEICRALDSPIANVSHHLRMLKDVGMVSARKRGRFVIYELNHVAQPSHAGTHLLDFGCCRVEFVESSEDDAGAAASPRVEDQALLILNRILGGGGTTSAESPKRAKGGRRGPAGRIEIVNASFEHPPTAFFDTTVAGWTKEGDPSGTGVFHNFPDDTPMPGSRKVRNADGAQLATVGARNPGGPVRASGLLQSLAGVTYKAGAGYVLTLGVGVSSVQPPATDGKSPPALRFALTYADDAGRRHEVVGRSVTPTDLAATSDPLAYLSVATTLAGAAASACAGREIGILISTAENTPGHAGNFILDNVTLVADAPSRPSRGKPAAAAGAKRRSAARKTR